MKNEKLIHGEEVPFWKKHGYSATPPVPCDFKLGDEVIFTNAAGLKFRQKVRGFTHQEMIGACRRFILVFDDGDAWWFPVAPETLRHVEAKS